MSADIILFPLDPIRREIDRIAEASEEKRRNINAMLGRMMDDEIARLKHERRDSRG